MIRVTIYSLCMVSALLSSTNARAADEVMIGPVPYVQDVNGIKVKINARSYFRINTQADGIQVNARLVGNLEDLQKKFGSIVDTFPLPADNCKSYSGNNPVVKIPRKELAVSGSQAIISLGASVAMWDCRENPVPNSKVEWENKNIGFGIKTKVPVVKTWPGDPIKNKYASQSIDADIPVALNIADPHSIRIILGRPDIELKGQYAFVTKGILSIAGVNVNDYAYDALQEAIEPEKLLLTLPEEYLDLEPSVTTAQFINDEGTLAAYVELSASISPDRATEFVKMLIN